MSIINSRFYRNTGENRAGKYVFCMVYDHRGRFIDILAYPSEIRPVHIGESGLAEVLSLEALAEEMAQGVK